MKKSMISTNKQEYEHIPELEDFGESSNYLKINQKFKTIYA